MRAGKMPVRMGQRRTKRRIVGFLLRPDIAALAEYRPQTAMPNALRQPIECDLCWPRIRRRTGRAKDRIPCRTKPLRALPPAQPIGPLPAHPDPGSGRAHTARLGQIAYECGLPARRPAIAPGAPRPAIGGNGRKGGNARDTARLNGGAAGVWGGGRGARHARSGAGVFLHCKCVMLLTERRRLLGYFP